jgi:hypothetical protein
MDQQSPTGSVAEVGLAFSIVISRQCRGTERSPKEARSMGSMHPETVSRSLL